MSNHAKVLDWNGRDVPSALAALPPGQYLIEPVEPLASWNLSATRVTELEAAMDAHDRGEGIPAGEVLARLRERSAARRSP